MEQRSSIQGQLHHHLIALIIRPNMPFNERIFCYTCSPFPPIRAPPYKFI